MSINLDSPSTEEFLNECKTSWETKRDEIVSESSFNSYQQNPEYIKSMLILEAVRIMLTELAPKRRRRRMAESTETSMEETMSPDLNDNISLGRAMMQWSQDQRGTDDATLRKMNAFSRVGEKLVNQGTAFQSPLTANEQKVKAYAKAMFAKQAAVSESPSGLSEQASMLDLFAELGRAMMDYSQNPGIDASMMGGKDETVLADLNAISKVGDKITTLKTSFGPTGITKSDLQVIMKAMPRVASKINLDPADLTRLQNIVSNTAKKAGLTVSEASVDQDKDGDKDFADVQIARMVAGGMPKPAAIAKTKDKEYNKESAGDESIMENMIDEPSGAPAATGQLTLPAGGKAVGHAHHYEYQASMSRSELYRNSKYAMSMLKQIDPQAEVQPWIAGALTKAAGLLDKVYHYLDYYKKFEPEELPEGDEDAGLGETSGGVSRQNLMLIMEYSIKLFEMIKPGDKLEGWVAMKLTTASECISSCKHYMDYVQFEQHAMDDHFADGIKATRKEVVESIQNLSEQEDLAKASTILAAKDMSTNVQDIAEDVAKMSVEDLMPLVNIMRSQFGQEVAMGFNSTVKAALDELLKVTTNTKETMDAAIDTLNSGGIPAATSDIESAGTEGGEEGDDSDISADLAAIGTETGPTAAQGETEPLGRAKKDEVAESLAVGKKVNVTNPKATPRYEIIKIDGDKITLKKPDGSEMTLPKARIMRANPGLTEGKIPDAFKKNIEKMKAKAKNKKADNTKKEEVDEALDSEISASTRDLNNKKAELKKLEKQKASGVNLGNKDLNKEIANAKAAIKKLSKQVNESEVEETAPPGKKAEDFIKSNKDDFKKRYGNRWQEVLYATAWKQFGKKDESFVSTGKALAEAKVELQQLEAQMLAHRNEFKSLLKEGTASDPLQMGYGLEGDSILDRIAVVNKTIAAAKNTIRQQMQEGVIGMLRTIESLNKAAALEEVKNITPYGVIYTTKSGRKSKKMFESADARAYWLELKADMINNPRMIEPESFTSAINRAARG
jgi:hypothetical protein